MPQEKSTMVEKKSNNCSIFNVSFLPLAWTLRKVVSLSLLLIPVGLITTLKSASNVGGQHYEQTNRHLINLADFSDPKSIVIKDHLEVSMPIIADINDQHSLEFWNKRSQGGEPELCGMLRSITGVSVLGSPSETPMFILLSTPAPLIRFTYDCSRQNRIGNVLFELYIVRLTVALARADFEFKCKEETSDPETQVLPWLTGYFHYAGDPKVENYWPFDLERPHNESAFCLGYDFPLHYATHAIQKDMRRLAVLVLGVREGRDISLNGLDLPPILPPPLYPHAEIDDVALHFRCGDVLGGPSAHGFYGIIKFDEYKRQISPEAQSIGIHTQSFDPSLLRDEDRDKTHNCHLVVLALFNYLKSAFPDALVTVRNTPDDTNIPLTWARMVMANQTFVSLTTFGIFPVISTFGQGYAQRGNTYVNPFVEHVPNILANIHIMDAPILSSNAIKKMSIDQVIQWLVEPREEEKG